MSLFLILLILILVFGSLPVYPYSRTWGYRPFSGVLGLVLMILIILLVFGGL